MKSRLGTLLLTSTALAILSCPARATELPEVKVTDTNAVPECVTPGRLMSYVKSRNEKLDPKFEEVATLYMRHGEELGIRWDYAFFQMMLETNTLKYTGDVKVTQNNFAGLGATGRGARGESFNSVSDGVRAHLQHLLMYAGDKIESPVAQRTRDIQEWGILTKWQATISGPMTYSQLAKKWAPTSRGYPRDVEKLAELFFEGACKADDPNPEMIAEARKGRGVETDGQVVAAGKGAEIAKKAIAEARAQGGPIAGLGAESMVASAAPAADSDSGPPVKLINGPVADDAIMGPPAPDEGPSASDQAGQLPSAKPDAAKAESTVTATASKPEASKPEASKAITVAAVMSDPVKEPSGKAGTKPEAAKGETNIKSEAKAETKSVAAAPTDSKPSTAPAKEEKVAAVETAALAAPLLGDAKPSAATDAKCRVFTASYGGSKSIIIKAATDGITNYTVLDVNDGAEKREADAYIGAYAKGGETVGDPQPQEKALEQAFELCPEG